MNDIERLYSILMDDNVSTSINENLSTLLLIIPELKYMIGFEHRHPHHNLDVWNHTICALSQSIQNFDVRLVLLLHDIGKPFSYQEDGEIRHFKGHPKKSKEISEKILKRMKLDENYIKDICYLIENHDEPITQKDINFFPLLSEQRYEIQRCDTLAHNPEKNKKRLAYLKTISTKIKK